MASAKSWTAFAPGPTALGLAADGGAVGAVCRAHIAVGRAVGRICDAAIAIGRAVGSVCNAVIPISGAAGPICDATIAVGRAACALGLGRHSDRRAAAGARQRRLANRDRAVRAGPEI